MPAFTLISLLSHTFPGSQVLHVAIGPRVKGSIKRGALAGLECPLPKWTILNPQTMVKVIRDRETSEATFRDLKKALSAAIEMLGKTQLQVSDSVLIARSDMCMYSMLMRGNQGLNRQMNLPEFTGEKRILLLLKMTSLAFTPVGLNITMHR